MNSVKEKIDEIITSGKCMGLSMLSHTLNLSELDVCRELDKKDCSILDKSAFDKVWNFLCSFDALTFFIEKGGNIFEQRVKLCPGKDSMGYFNLFEKGCLNGHLKKESISKIALLKLPFMHLTSYQIAFIGEDGNSLYNFYLPRYNHQHQKSDLVKFENFVVEAA